MTRARISTTVDRTLLDDARRLHAGTTDADLVDEALTALLARYRSAEIDAAHEAAHGAHPIDGYAQLLSPVDAGAVVDAQHDDGVLALVDLVDHPVGAAAGRVQPGENTLEASTDAVWIVHEGAQHELDDRRGGAFGETPQLTLSGCGDSELVGSVGVGHFAAKRARSSSPVM